MKKYLAVVLVLLFSSMAVCSWAGPPYDVDDPGTPELHHFEFNIGFLSSQVRGSETQEFPGFDLNYGYRNNLQLTLGIAGISVRNAGTGRTAGVGDLSAEVKWRFKEETKKCPQMGLHYLLQIPTASSSRGLGTGHFDHALVFSTQKSFGRSTLFGNFGYTVVGDRSGRNSYLYGLVYTHQMTEHLNVGGEIYGNTSSAAGERDELAIGLGLTYNYAPDRAFLLKVGRSMHGLSDVNAYAGIQIVFK